MLVKRLIVSGFLTLFLIGPVQAQVTITIDEATKYQTIEGVGVCGAAQPWWSGNSPATYCPAGFADTVFSSLGLTMMRDEVEAISDFVSPGVWNFNAQKPHFAYYRAMKAKGAFKLILSLWSPPVWMKSNVDASCQWGNPGECGGNLRTDMYDVFATMWLTLVKAIKDSCGVDVYAISLQNEPAFDEPYASCVYTAQTMHDVIKVVGKKFADAGTPVRIFAPEHMADADWEAPWFSAIFGDAQSSQYIYAGAVHGYHMDGVTPSSPDASHWQRMYQTCSTNGKELWMTETSGFTQDWAGAWNLAKFMFTAFKNGKISGWTYWRFNRDDTPTEAIFYQLKPTVLFYSHKLFARYLRPGARQVSATSSNEATVSAAAFTHTGFGSLTVVLINQSASAQTVSLAITPADGINPAQFTGFRTSSAANFTTIPGIGTTGISLPGNSLTTLVSSIPPITATSVERRAPVARVQAVMTAYALDGKRLGPRLQHGAATGAYLCVPDARSPGAIAVGRIAR